MSQHDGLVDVLQSGKMDCYFPVKFPWLRDPHDLQGIATDAGAEVFSGRYSLGSWVQQNVEWRLLQRPFDSELVAGVFDP
jgi:hypothetical protein